MLRELANDSIIWNINLSNDSVAVFQSIAQVGYPTAKFYRTNSSSIQCLKIYIYGMETLGKQ